MNAASFVREVEIPSRFIGPDGIVNGGYLAGLLGREVDGPVEVSFRRPTPPDRPLALHAPDEASRELRDGGVLLASVRRASLAIEVPEPVSFELASTVGGEYAALDGHPFPRCFVCGPERAPGDALRVFPGAVEPGRVAAPVVFSPAFADEDGVVRPEHVTAALECPGGFAIVSADPRDHVPMLLASYALRREAPVRAGERCVVVGLASGAEGRKRFATTALYGEDGSLRACARELWIIVA